MASYLTWHNISVVIGLAIGFITVLVAIDGVMIQWRFDGLQHQLSDRMTLYEREMGRLEKRIDRLEAR